MNMFRSFVVFILACIPAFMSGQAKYAAVTDAEYALITSPDDKLRILNIFDSSDSIVLRTPSIDVDVSDTIWNYLAQRMCLVAQEEGVGIAAPRRTSPPLRGSKATTTTRTFTRYSARNGLRCRCFLR